MREFGALVRRVPFLRGALLVLGINALALINWDEAWTITIDPLFNGAPALDWDLYRDAGRLIASGQSPYLATVEACGENCVFRHSPLVAWFYAVPYGVEWFRAWQLIALVLLPPAVGVAVVATWAFWSDVAMAQPITFALVLAVLALRGSRSAGVAFLVMATLMPRPLMVPVAIWLLWRNPNVRVPFVALTAVHLVLVLLSGWALDWAASVFTATADLQLPVNVSPSRWIGLWWLLIGIPLAVWLVRRGELGLASLAVSPYLLPYYLLFGVLPPARSEPAPLILTHVYRWLRPPRDRTLMTERAAPEQHGRDQPTNEDSGTDPIGTEY